MPDALSNIRTRRTVAPQNTRVRADQVRNNAGGYVFKTSDANKIQRFLTLGTEGGTYYQNEKPLTAENAKTVLAAAQDSGRWLTERIRAVSEAGRAPRQNPGLFALAAASGLGSFTDRRAALGALPHVARTGSSLLTYAGYVENFRGWGRGLRGAVADWYTEKDVDALAYQLIKYRQRDGWSQRDLMRLAHPRATGSRDALFHWVTRKALLAEVPQIVRAHVEAMESTNEATWLRLIAAHRLPWEALPDAALTNANVWRALIENGLPQTALMRQLPRLTNLGVLEGDTLKVVCAQLQDEVKLRHGRVHPMNILVAMKTYASGRSMAGTNTWKPKRQVVDALDAAFYRAFRLVEPSGKRTLLALDVSGSMGSPVGAPRPGKYGAATGPLSCREATAALALVTMATEPETTCVGFTSGGRGFSMRDSAITELGISPRQRLDDAARSIAGLSFGGTDCALPMLWAKQNRLDFDTICVYTDNETWAGNVQPMQALRQYREAVGHDVRLVVVGMTATDFTIADPNDPGSLDVAGFDANVPNLISDFSRGDV